MSWSRVFKLMMMMMLLPVLMALRRNSDSEAITGRKSTVFTTVTHSPVNSAAQITLSQFRQ